jgi:hypothetical protein
MNDELLKRLIDVLERVERHLATPVATPTPTDTKVTPGRDTKNAEKCRKYRARKRVADTGSRPEISLSLVSKKDPSKEESKKEPRSEIEALGKNWPRDFREKFWAAYPKKVEKPYALKCLDKVRRSNVVEFPELLAGVARIDRSDPKFIKNPSTWLNRGCWTDGEGVITEEAERAAMLEEFHRAQINGRNVNGQGRSEAQAAEKSRTDNNPELRPDGAAVREIKTVARQLAFPQSRRG